MVCKLRHNHNISLTKFQIKDLLHLLSKLGDSDIPIFFDWKEAKSNVTNYAVYSIDTNHRIKDKRDTFFPMTATVDSSSRAAVTTALVTSH